MSKLCVVSDVIGNRDVIHNGENGFVCKDLWEYVRAIQEDDTGNMKKKELMRIY